VPGSVLAGDATGLATPTKRRLTWPNGAIATTYSADEPERLRGPQHDAAWCDERATVAEFARMCRATVLGQIGWSGVGQHPCLEQSPGNEGRWLWLAETQRSIEPIGDEVADAVVPQDLQRQLRMGSNIERRSATAAGDFACDTFGFARVAVRTRGSLPESICAARSGNPLVEDPT
jgi:hypothetical protein